MKTKSSWITATLTCLLMSACEKIDTSATVPSTPEEQRTSMLSTLTTDVSTFWYLKQLLVNNVNQNLTPAQQSFFMKVTDNTKLSQALPSDPLLVAERTIVSQYLKKPTPDYFMVNADGQVAKLDIVKASNNSNWNLILDYDYTQNLVNNSGKDTFQLVCPSNYIQGQAACNTNALIKENLLAMQSKVGRDSIVYIFKNN